MSCGSDVLTWIFLFEPRFLRIITKEVPRVVDNLEREITSVRTATQNWQKERRNWAQNFWLVKERLQRRQRFLTYSNFFQTERQFSASFVGTAFHVSRGIFWGNWFWFFPKFLFYIFLDFGRNVFGWVVRTVTWHFIPKTFHPGTFHPAYIPPQGHVTPN